MDVLSLPDVCCGAAALTLGLEINGDFPAVERDILGGGAGTLDIDPHLPKPCLLTLPRDVLIFLFGLAF